MKSATFEQMLQWARKQRREVDVGAHIEVLYDQYATPHARGRRVATYTEWVPRNGIIEGTTFACELTREQAEQLLAEGAWRSTVPTLPYAEVLANRRSGYSQWTAHDGYRVLKVSYVASDPTGTQARLEAQRWIHTLLEAAGVSVELSKIEVSVEFDDRA